MVELDAGAGPVVLDGGRQAGEPRNKGVVMGPDIGGVAGKLIHRGISHADDAGPAPGPFFVKRDKLVGDFKIHGHSQVHGGQENAVFDVQCIDFYRFKQRVSHGGILIVGKRNDALIF